MSNPITGICIVADPYKCPPKYELLFKSYDRKDDCDLWKDGVFRSKTSRYICISRAPDMAEKCNGVSCVMTDILIQNEREIPPFGYTLLEKTVDTAEKATKKKQIGVKMIPHNMTETAIIELTMLSKTKRSPPGFTLIGEINGLCLYTKIGSISADSTQTVTVIEAGVVQPSVPQQSSSPINNGMQRSSEQSSNSLMSRSETPTLVLSNGMLVMNCSGGGADSNTVVASDPSQVNYCRSTSVQPLSPLSDVPFQLHAKFTKDSLRRHASPAEHFKTIADIESEFSYTFSLENSIIQQMSTPCTS